MGISYKNFIVISETDDVEYKDKVILAYVTEVITKTHYPNAFAFWLRPKDISTEKEFQVIKCAGSTFFMTVDSSEYFGAGKDMYQIHQAYKTLGREQGYEYV